MPLENYLVQRAAVANMNNLYDAQAQLEVNMQLTNGQLPAMLSYLVSTLVVNVSIYLVITITIP